MSNIFNTLETVSGSLKFIIRDENGIVVPSGSLGTFQLTLFNSCQDTNSKYHLAIINSRYNQNVLNTNNVTIDGNGQCSYSIQPADMAIVDSTQAEETHIARFSYFWSGKKGIFEAMFIVKNLDLVTS